MGRKKRTWSPGQDRFKAAAAKKPFVETNTFECFLFLLSPLDDHPITGISPLVTPMIKAPRSPAPVPLKTHSVAICIKFVLRRHIPLSKTDLGPPPEHRAPGHHLAPSHHSCAMTGRNTVPKQDPMQVAMSMRKRATEKEERAIRRRIERRLVKNKDGILQKAVKWFAEEGQQVVEEWVPSDVETEAAAEGAHAEPVPSINKNFTKLNNMPLVHLKRITSPIEPLALGPDAIKRLIKFGDREGSRTRVNEYIEFATGRAPDIFLFEEGREAEELDSVIQDMVERNVARGRLARDFVVPVDWGLKGFWNAEYKDSFWHIIHRYAPQFTLKVRHSDVFGKVEVNPETVRPLMNYSETRSILAPPDNPLVGVNIKDLFIMHFTLPPQTDYPWAHMPWQATSSGGRKTICDAPRSATSSDQAFGNGSGKRGYSAPANDIDPDAVGVRAASKTCGSSSPNVLKTPKRVHAARDEPKSPRSKAKERRLNAKTGSHKAKAAPPPEEDAL